MHNQRGMGGCESRDDTALEGARLFATCLGKGFKGGRQKDRPTHTASRHILVFSIVSHKGRTPCLTLVHSTVHPPSSRDYVQILSPLLDRLYTRLYRTLK